MHPSARARTLALLLLAACPLAIWSQGITAVVLGRVVDESGSPVAAATVTARHLGTGLTRTAATDASGSYRLPALPVGTYEVTVDKAGFARQVRPEMTLSVGQEATVDFSLRLASFSETLTVQGEAPIVETTKSAPGTTVTTQQIDELPLLDRDFTHLASLAPGIQRSATEATDISANGASGSSNTFLIDGLSIDQDALGDLRGDFSPDAIAEFQVLSSQYSAEFGQAAGAVINVAPSGRRW